MFSKFDIKDRCSQQIQESFINSSNSFFHVIYPFSNSVIIFSSPYFTLKLFYFFCIRLLLCLSALTIDLIKFSFVILEYPILFVLFDPIPVPFESSFFHQYLLTYFFQTCLLGVFSFRWIPVYFTFLSSFVCYRTFFKIRHSNLISPSRFRISIRILLWNTNFCNWLIFLLQKLICSVAVKLCVQMCWNNLFTLSHQDFFPVLLLYGW